MKKQDNHATRRRLILFLQAVTVLIGVVVLVLMLLEPHLEGRNTHASLFQIYFNDPFLAYVYVGSIPFFVALFQAVKLLGYIGQNTVFSRAGVNALKTIKYCAFTTAAAIVVAGVYLRVVAAGSNDDPAGAVMLGIIAAFVSVVIGAAATVLEKKLQSAADTPSTP